jgi:hypothetical protein
MIGRVLAQSQPATASLSGHILSEEGRALRAAVTLSWSGPRGFPSPPRRVFTNANGSFSFFRLPAGKYVLCAQVSAAEAAPANSPWVDTCVWPTNQTPITLTAGQQLAGIVFGEKGTDEFSGEEFPLDPTNIQRCPVEPES